MQCDDEERNKGNCDTRHQSFVQRDVQVMSPSITFELSMLESRRKLKGYDRPRFFNVNCKNSMHLNGAILYAVRFDFLNSARWRIYGVADKNSINASGTRDALKIDETCRAHSIWFFTYNERALFLRATFKRRPSTRATGNTIGLQRIYGIYSDFVWNKIFLAMVAMMHWKR